ncbi:hypothetical protein [Roseofilum sp. Guam]|nr:hypothetical protein [Roseofilum sp. Guam]MBP0030855.1 hypothetical protein [Roseofilum sp. Guam]
MIQYSDRLNSTIGKAISPNKETGFLATSIRSPKIPIETRFLTALISFIY